MLAFVSQESAIVAVVGAITTVLLALINASSRRGELAAALAASNALRAAEAAATAATSAKHAAVVTNDTATVVQEVKNLVNGTHTKMEERFEALTAELKQANIDKARLEQEAKSK